MTTATPSRRLYRSRSDRMLGGVAGGVAAYLQVDPSLTRLAFAALVLAAGAGLLVYIIAWIVIPEEPVEASRPASPPPPDDRAPAELPAASAAALSGPPPTAAPAPPARSGSAAGRNARLVAGTALVLLGTLFLLDWALPDLRHYFWPGAIIAFGLGLLAYGARR